ncbi:uncharacterized protein [Ambystoma mexicanum]|uniref:uncharacterized protein n=1 Tax=Ambystoma mexicanum TaxID=8296 RepID=UPI0037E7EBCA
MLLTMEPGPESKAAPDTEQEKSGKTEESIEKPGLVVTTGGRKGAPVRSLFYRVVTFGPLKYVFRFLREMMALVGFSAAVEDVGSVDLQTSSPSARRVKTGKKRLGRLARLLLSVAPQRLQNALGYPLSKGLGDSSASEEVRRSPTKPCGKGSKRKADDLDMEEQPSWIEALAEDLPDENEEGDVTYQLSKSETDSEEYRSKNDTESDLEFEEKDGQIMLKETTTPQVGPNGEAAVNGDMVNGVQVRDGSTVDEDLANGVPEAMSNGDRERKLSSTE